MIRWSHRRHGASQVRRTSQGGDDRILGFTKLGAEARHVIAVVQTAMVAAMRCTVLRDSIIAHPTMAEGLGVFFSNVPIQQGARGALVRPQLLVLHRPDRQAMPRGRPAWSGMGHGRRFGSSRTCFSTASVSRRSTGPIGGAL
ncbi:MAG: hypothetical protein WA709_17615 [Stellaceae bacterium]